MPTTSNFGWTTPADTDLVKDGAAAIRTLGNGIDTSLVDLKGGTSGQVLSKNSNTDLDYTWVTPNVGDITEVQAGTGISIASGTGPIPVVTNTVATAFDAAGDLVYGTGADTFTKLGIGTAGQVLKVNSGATAPEWGAAAAAADNWTLISGQSVTAVSSVTFSSLTTYKKLLLICSNFWGSLTTNQIYYRLNADSASNYKAGPIIKANSGNRNQSGSSNEILTNWFTQTQSGGDRNAISILIDGCNGGGRKPYTVFAGGYNGSAQDAIFGSGYYDSTSDISTINITLSGGNITSSSGGTNEFQLWGVA